MASERLAILAQVGFTLGNADALQRSLDVARQVHEEREAGRYMFEPAQGTGSMPDPNAINCPRCVRPTCAAKLVHGEKVAWCGNCRYAMPLPAIVAASAQP